VTNANYGSGSCLVTVTKAADNNYFEATDSIELSTFRTGQSAFSVTGGTTLTYGATLDLDPLGGSGEGNVSFAVTGGTATCSIDSTTGVLSVTNAAGAFDTPKIPLLTHSNAHNFCEQWTNCYPIQAPAPCSPCYRIVSAGDPCHMVSAGEDPDIAGAAKCMASILSPLKIVQADELP
jgi:hypothetical protein